MNLLIVHEDPPAAQALAASLRLVWPGLEIGCHPADALSSHTIILTNKQLDHNPADRTMVLDGAPLRFKTLAKQLENLLNQCYWPPLLVFDGAQLNTRTREWHRGAEETALTEKEVGVMVYLWQQTMPVSREDLLRDVWHYAADADTHTIETHIYRLRQKIETDPAAPTFLLTMKDGYQLAARAKA